MSFSILKNSIVETNNMENNFSKVTDEELEGIIRLHENSNIPGGRFQRAMTELDLRYKKRGYQPGLHIEAKGDITMGGSQVILGENNTMTIKTKKKLVQKNIKFLQNKRKEKFITMDNPMVHFIVNLVLIVVVAYLAYFAYTHHLPFKFN